MCLTTSTCAVHPASLVSTRLLYRYARRRGFAAALAFVALFATACGGDGASGPGATSIAISSATQSIRVGESTQLTGSPVDAAQRVVSVPGTMTWSSSATAIATVTATGNVTGVSPGDADITARIGEVTGTIRITVLQLPVARIDVTPTNVEFGRSQTRQLTASAFAADNTALTGRTFTWASNNTAVATVSATTGASVTVTAVAPGNAVISATSEGVIKNVPVAVQPDPVITFTPPSATLGTTAGGSNPAPATVTVTNTGGGTLAGLATGPVTYTSGQPAGWLTAAFESGTTASAPLTLRATLGTLPVGSYAASVPVSSTSPGAAAKNLAVTFTVGSAIVLGANPTSESFTAPGGSGNPASKTINIFSVNGSVIPNLTAGAVEYSGAATNWLTATLSGSSTPATLTLQPNVGTLASGTYTANVPIAAPTASNTPLKVAVTLVVPQPLIALSATSRSFEATQGIGTANAQTVTISNGGRGPLTGLQVSVSYGAGATGWLNAQLNTTTAPATLTLTPVGNSIARGQYSATVQVQATGVSNSPQPVSVAYRLIYTFDHHIAGTLAATALPAGCANSACHDAGGQVPVMGSGTGDVYLRLMSSYVSAGNPGGSPLYQRLNSTTSPMPPSGIVPAIRDVVGHWITDGAKRN